MNKYITEESVTQMLKPLLRIISFPSGPNDLSSYSAAYIAVELHAYTVSHYTPVSNEA